MAEKRNAKYRIQRVQEVLGHNELETTVIYTHILERGLADVNSPIDDL